MKIGDDRTALNISVQVKIEGDSAFSQGIADCTLSDISLDYEVSSITHFHLKANKCRPLIWKHVCVCTTSVLNVTNAIKL